MAKRKTKARRKRGPNRTLESRIAELEKEIGRLQDQVQLGRTFSPSVLARHRAQLELSAADYAELCGVSPLTIYNWEKGRTRPRASELERWLAVKALDKRKAWKSLGYAS